MTFSKLALAVIEIEAQAVLELTKRINDSFEQACEILLNCQGRIVVTGMGKSGHIANKISSTLSSTGTPSFFLHPAEASHGDMGMITKHDVVIALSNSGSTEEIITLIPVLKRLSVPIIALTGNLNSTLAKAAEVVIDVSVSQEACPMGLAPTTSTTVSLVMGDALAIALLQAKGFTEKDFALSHPGGTLGRRLLLRIDDLYHEGEALPLVDESATISEALIEVTAKKLGMTCVVNKQGILTGVYTDGDIRRTLNQQIDINTTPITVVMNKHCKTIPNGILAAEALALMEKFSITSLVVINEWEHPKAVIHLHDLLKAGVY